ncbi:uncharacterized protein BJ212DRAFT_1443436 [Suillus subaureus]|uniref:CxC2-like cysteine cluster KDZ transposase-associated domain-containing protein n=1 Tax=Suillus subaureus TaxID=48587 RepID=A0A9P7EPR1_9AGAM|nr:uncharacterized protein BJ212DRAFT_1443436 [Suillus subaureus]KAG1827344.1 hypothetical protein BJ212DRAFT_1443436 [Suillus subaureus]
MVIIDKSGVHCLEVQCCDCPNAMSPDIQMFQHGFFPTSFNKLKTLFTFMVLDDFLLDNLESPWRQLKAMKWHGFGHHSNNPNAGDLTLFCPTWNESLDNWKYTQLFVMDGNFKAEHLHPIKPFDEVWLFDELGFMVGKDRYKTHLAEAADTLKKLSCNNHQAVNQANVTWHKLESTGIRGVTYFQKGKRQAKHAI